MKPKEPAKAKPTAKKATKETSGKHSKTHHIDLTLCNSHSKKIEAFCLRDRAILCIDCILSEEHKGHEINSIQKAAEQERERLAMKFREAEELNGSLEDTNE